jgi:hypothetical protein
MKCEHALQPLQRGGARDPAALDRDHQRHGAKARAGHRHRHFGVLVAH